MPKKNRSPWKLRKPVSEAVAHSEPAAPAATAPQTPSFAPDLAPISPAQLAANRANAQLSTGPRTTTGLERSSKNAVKTALTGRTVLLPTDEVEEYAALVASFQNDFKPIGPQQCELVQIIADCHWRLRRIQELEYALYAHGDEQFADLFPNAGPQERHSKTLLQTYLTYEKQLRNLHIQEARIDRKRTKALAELRTLQAEHTAPADDNDADQFQGFPSEQALFAALDAGYVPPHLAAYLSAGKSCVKNGFEFSNDTASRDLAVGETLEKAAA